MKEGWTYKKLGDICDIKSGKSIKAEDIHLKQLGDDVPCYGGNGLRGYVQKPNSKGGNPIIGRVGAQCGNIHYCEKPFYATEHALVVSLLTKEVNPIWFCYLLETMNLKRYAEGAAQPVIAASRLKPLEFLLPPIFEQQLIVSRLDDAYAHIEELKANAEKQLKDARMLFQKALAKAMEPKKGWEEKKLVQITNKIGSGATPRGGKKVYINNGTSLVRSMNVHNNEFKYTDLAHLNEEAANQLNGVELKQDDVLFNITGASIARCCIVPEDVLPGRVNQHVAIVRPRKDFVLPKFLCLCLLSAEHQKELLEIGVAGSTRQAITKADLEEHIVFLPSLSEQQRIVERLDALSTHVRELEENQKKIINECDALKQALLRKVFE